MRDQSIVGLLLGGDEHRVTGNPIGTCINGDHTVTDNYVVGNADGLLVLPGRLDVRRNTVTGQLQTGITLADSGPGAYASLVLTSNDVFGNALATGSNRGMITSHAQIIDVERNFWGRAAGPGPDPGDQACGALDVTPFAPARSRS